MDSRRGLRRPLKARAFAATRRIDRGDRIQIALSLPEIRPWTAAQSIEIADFHDPLPAFAHEGERSIERNDLDAVLRGSQNVLQEAGVRLE